MVIAIDYDKTFTAAPGLWCQFAGLCRVNHAQLICVTGRNESQPIEDPRLTVPIIYAAGEYKADAARRAGYAVDIWIDDEPGQIEPPRKLQW